MKIHLVTNTPNPGKAIAAAFINMGIGKDVKSLDDITDAEAENALSEIFKSHLTAPLEFASFNFFWEDIPIFLRAQLVRHRVGWSYAERSLRFYDANLKDPTKKYDWDAMPSLKGMKFVNPISGSEVDMNEVMQQEMERQMIIYSAMIKQKIDQQDARNVIGVWYPTSMQTATTYRALRETMADRLSSQAHPLWQKAAKQIKELVSSVDKQLGDGLIDRCALSGRCVWLSKYDRGCPDCVARGWRKEHVHVWDRDTTFGKNTQCNCGTINKKLLNTASTSSSQEKS